MSNRALIESLKLDRVFEANPLDLQLRLQAVQVIEQQEKKIRLLERSLSQYSAAEKVNENNGVLLSLADQVRQLEHKLREYASSNNFAKDCWVYYVAIYVRRSRRNPDFERSYLAQCLVGIEQNGYC